LRNIAKQYFVSAASLHRHKKDHLPAKLVKAQEAREIAKADSLLDQVIELRDKALSILTQKIVKPKARRREARSGNVATSGIRKGQPTNRECRKYFLNSRGQRPNPQEIFP